MGKRSIMLLLVLIVIFFGFRFCNSKPEKTVAVQKPEPLAVSENSGPFNQSFSTLLNVYYSLKDAFVEADLDKINSSAAELVASAGNLKVDEIKGDTSGMIRETAKHFAESIGTTATQLSSQNSLEDKKRDFEIISDAMWSLTRTVRYDGQKVYYHFCPMAFDQKGAYWLSSRPETENPYLGNKMPACSELADSLDYSKR